MTWLELQESVFTLLSYAGQRETHEAYLKQQIRFAALDLQRFIPAYRKGHESKVYEADIVLDGQSGSILLPEGADLKGVWVSDARSYQEFLTGEQLILPLQENQPANIALTVTAWLAGNAGDTVTLGFDDQPAVFASTDGVDDYFQTAAGFVANGTLLDVYATTRAALGESIGFDGETAATQTLDNEWETHQLASGYVYQGFSLDFAVHSGGFGSTEADWRDVEIYNATTGDLLIRYKLDGHASGSLDGKSITDSSGNGYDGTHIGGTGAAGTEAATYVIQKTDVWELATFEIETFASSLRSELRLRGDGTSLKVAEVSTAGTYEAFYDIGATACEREASRIPARFHPWDRRAEMVCGNMSLHTRAAYAYEPRTRELLVWPAPANPEGGYVIYRWDGRKLTFADEDTVPFDEMCIQAIFNYVRSRMLTDVDGDRTEGWKLMQTYEAERTQLYAEANK